MQNTKLVSTPLEAHFKLSATLSPKTNDERDYMSRVSYSSVVGSLMYVMVCSWPDLSYAISAVRRYMENPGKEHWKEIQWIFRYLHGSADVYLQFGQNRDGVICQSAIFLTKNQMFHERTKRINVWYHFLHKIIARGDIVRIPVGFLKYVKGQDQIEHVVLRSGGKNWLVKVKCWRFGAGWAAFVEQHDLQVGDILVFRHDGNMEFEVSIFDSTHCDREYAEYLQEEDACNNVEEITSKKFKFKGRSRPRIKLSKKVSSHVKAATRHKSFGHSHYECTIRKRDISQCYL
ncbi:hypothetical protein T459_03669, partial [Capsicum annuum]